MEYLLTAEEVKKLEERIKQLESEAKETRKELNDLIESDSDYMLNSRYVYLRSKLNIQIPNDIEHIKKKIRTAKIIANEDFMADGATVAVGTKVTLNYEGDIEEIYILPIAENNVHTKEVSTDAPIVKLIIGKEIGDVVVFNNIKVKIVNIEKM